MKIISKFEDLLLMMVNSSTPSYALSDFEMILNAFGDDWHMEGGTFIRVTENENMAELRRIMNEQTENRGD